MTLLEQVHTLKSQISQGADARASEVDLNWLRTRNEQLTPIAENLLAILKSTSVLRANGLNVFIDGEEIRELRTSIDVIRGKFDDDSVALLTSTSKPDPRIQRLKALTDHLANNIKEAWQTFCDGISDPVDSGLMQILRNDPSQSDVISQVNDLRANLTRLREIVPIDQETFERPVQLANELRHLINTRPSLPDEVKRLIESIEEGSASLSDITPEIHEWLENNNLLTHLGISWKHNGFRTN